MGNETLTTILGFISPLLLGLGGGWLTYLGVKRSAATNQIIKEKEAREAAETRQQEIQNEREKAVAEAQQAITETAVSLVQPLKEENKRLSERLSIVEKRLEDERQERKQERIQERSEINRLNKENIKLRRRVAELEKMVNAPHIETDDLDTPTHDIT